MGSKFMRYALLIAYGLCTLWITFGNCLAISVGTSGGQVVSASDFLVLWGIQLAVYLPFQILGYLHIRKTRYRTAAFQWGCLAIDLVAVTMFIICAVTDPKEFFLYAWGMIFVIAQRTVILMLFRRKLPKS